MGKMKDKKIEKDITEVVKLTEKLNTLVLKLRKQDVSIMFDIDHSMQPSEYIRVSKASQHINYMASDEKKSRFGIPVKASADD